MIAKLGQDGHDRGAKVVATAFADLGFDVDIGPLFQTPEEARARPSRTTCTRSACRPWPPATRRWCRHHQGAARQGADDIIVFVGGVIPAQDYDFLYKAGAKGIFGPGTPIPQCAKHEVLRAIRAATCRLSA
jgi:methylmalonyl-CoA mutase